MLANRHDRAGFTCGVEALDRYLHQQAGQDAKHHATVTYVLVPADAPTIITGFCTLSSASIRLDALPADIAKRLPRYPNVPATLIGRLAVSSAHHRRGLGAHLLLDALRRSLEASAAIGSTAVIVDAKDRRAREFYERYGFIVFPDHRRRLFLPMKTIQALFIER